MRLIERKLDALTQLLHATASSDSEEALLDKVAEALLELFPQAEAIGVLVEEERSGELRVRCQRHRPRADGSSSTGPRPELRVPGAIIQHVVSDRRGVLLGERADDTDEAIGTRMGAPLLYHGVHYGLVYVEADEQAFRQDDVDLLQAIATQAGLAMHATRVAAQLAQREQLERDLRVARQIQRSLLPATVPNVVGLDFAVHYEPAYQIGGDFCDFIWHDPSHLGLVVGDVAGKAISAALYMARVTSELRSRAAIARTPARLLRRVNQEIAQLGDDGMFATLVYCIYDLELRSLLFTNAGHCVPLLRRGDRVFPLKADRAHTPPIGVTPELDAGEARVQLHSGDMPIMVSDGILEARDARGTEYGLSRRIRTAGGGFRRRGQSDPRRHRWPYSGSAAGRRHDHRGDGDRRAPGQTKDHNNSRDFTGRGHRDDPATDRRWARCGRPRRRALPNGTGPCHKSQPRRSAMAKKGKSGRELIRLVSTADTGYFYTTSKNRKRTPDKLVLKKYDPVVRKHVEFKESKI